MVVGKGGNGPGVHVIVALHEPSGIVFVCSTNVFGLFDEHEFMLEELMAPIVAAHRSRVEQGSD